MLNTLLLVLGGGIVFMVGVLIWLVWVVDWERLEADLRARDEERLQGKWN